MAILTKAQLEALNQSSFPDNTTGAITPQILREYNTATIDTLVDSLDTGSFVQDLTSLNAFTQSQDTKNSTLATYTGSNDTKWNTLGGQTGSYVTSAVTGSSLITASFSGNTLTFTKGNGTQFGVVIPDVSGSTIPAGTISGSSQITALGFVSSSVTGSSLVTGSVVGNVLTFTKGDATQFSLTVATGSGGGGTIDTGSFATTGSNVFRGDQTIQSDGTKNGIFFISGSEFFVGQNELGRFVISSSNQNRWLELNNDNGYFEVYAQTTNFNNGVNLRARTEARTFIQDFGYPCVINGTLSASLASGYAFVGGADGYSKQVPTASFAGAVPVGTATTGSNTFNGDQTISGSLIVTNIIKGTGSVILQPDVNDARVLEIYNTSATDTHITASGGNLFLGNDETYVLATTYANQKLVTIRGDQGISASGSLSISGSLTASLQSGYAWVGGVGNVSTLVPTSSFGGGGSTDTGSLMTTGSVSGNVLTFTKGDATTFTLTVATGSGGGTTFTNPSVESISGSLLLTANGFNSGSTSVLHLSASAQNQANLVFKNNNSTGTTIISGSNNIFVNPDAATTGFKRYFGNGNITLDSNQTLQMSASMAFSPVMNGNIINAQFNLRGPVSASTYTISNNTILGNTNFGSSDANNFEKIRGVFTYSQNLNIGTVTVIANKEIISGSTAIQRNVWGQGNTVNVNSSSVSITNSNINGSTINNNFFSGSAGNGQAVALNSFFNGSTINFEGQLPAGAANSPTITNSIVGGSTLHSNASTAPLVGTALRANIANSIMWGGNLIITGSAIGTATQTLGSAFFGRFNAQDGNRSKTGETVFAVGTGTSTSALKTGFLIDSGSNSYFEGTLNVSGSTTMTGSLILSSSNATELFVIGDSQFTGSISIAPTFQAKFATGSNQQAGTAVLDGGNPGTVVVSNSLVTANSIIMVSKQTLAHPNGYVAVSAKSAGTFTITSNHNGDADTVGWFIINNS